MKWRDRKGSQNVNTSNNSRGSRNPNIGIPRIPLGALLGGGGSFGIIVVIIIFLIMSGIIPLGNMSDNNGVDSNQSQSKYSDKAGQYVDGTGDPQTKEEMQQYISVVLADTESVWTKLFKDRGLSYNPPKLHIFDTYVRSGCGGATEQTGPFYCSRDETVYIDLSFYQDLKNKFGASGDFAMAYVIAHEVGHHVQNELDILDEANRARQRSNEKEANRISVRLELQADYFAGVVARFQQDAGYLEDGDLDEALKAASAIGDDKLQEDAYGRARPDTFTHGTSKQRSTWYHKGYKYADIEHGNTFEISYDQLFIIPNLILEKL